MFVLPEEEVVSSGSDSSPDHHNDSASGFGDLKKFVKQLKLKDYWPKLRSYLNGNRWFESAESRTVKGFARLITKSDLELALENVSAANTLHRELQRELAQEAVVSHLLD